MLAILRRWPMSLCDPGNRTHFSRKRAMFTNELAVVPIHGVPRHHYRFSGDDDGVDLITVVIPHQLPLEVPRRQRLGTLHVKNQDSGCLPLDQGSEVSGPVRRRPQSHALPRQPMSTQLLRKNRSPASHAPHAGSFRLHQGRESRRHVCCRCLFPCARRGQRKRAPGPLRCLSIGWRPDCS